MFSIRADTQNKKVFVSLKGQKLSRKMRDGIRESFIEIGNENVRFTRKEIKSKNKTGRLYGQHRASAPGQYPANETGALAKGVRFKTSGSTMRFGDTVMHGKFLEGGTKVGGKRRMAPRPHIRATVEARQRENFVILANGPFNKLNKP